MARKKTATADGYNNFMAQVGLRTNNAAAGGVYTQSFITRLQPQLEAMYRTSWIIGAVVDAVADDMTQGGIDINCDLEPESIGLMYDAIEDLGIWHALNSTIKWSRLYGSGCAVIVIDGQDMATPLRLETVAKDQFKGMIVLDRSQMRPNVNTLINELGPDFGSPEFYEAQALPQLTAIQGKIHHSRVIRMDGIELPFRQKMVENWWGESVVERIYDRVVAFDSTTQGAAQLVYKAYLRVLKIKDLRTIIGGNTQALAAITKNIEMIRQIQSNEGITLIDAEDEMEMHSYTFSGLDNVLLQFAQQLAGASEIPLVRLMGQSPAGLNATGESDIRNYYDGIRKKQETRLRKPLKKILELVHRSTFGMELPDGFRFTFRSLWQMSDAEKATIANTTVDAVTKAYAAGIVSLSVSMSELKQSSDVTGIFSSITDEDIAAADEEPPVSEALPDDTDPVGKDKADEL